MLAERLRVQPGSELRTIETGRASTRIPRSTARRRGRVGPGRADHHGAGLRRATEEATWLLAALDLAATRRARPAGRRVGRDRQDPAAGRGGPARGRARGDGAPLAADATGLDTLVAPADRLSLVIVETSIRPTTRSSVGSPARAGRDDAPCGHDRTCRDPVRVGDLQGVPKLVLSTSTTVAVAEIVRTYRPTVTGQPSRSPRW